MPKYYIYPFGVSGDLTPILDPTQPEGMVSYQQGFTINYQANLNTDPDARPVPRAQFNQLMYDVTANLQQYQQYSIPRYITSADNGGTPFAYPLFSVVRYNPGSGDHIYMNIVAGNTNNPAISGWITGTPLGNNSNIATYTTNGNFHVDTYVRQIFITAVAGGGGGGGSGGAASIANPSAAGGGGGGGCGQGIYRQEIIVTPGDTIAIVIGTGGAGGSAGTSTANGGHGVDGTNTTLISSGGVNIVLTGGLSGAPSAFAGAGGIVRQGGLGGGDTGQPGGSGYVSKDTGGSIYESAGGFGGMGGGSILGCVASGGISVRDAAGVAGVSAGGSGFGYGSGGGGASGGSVSTSLGPAFNGAAGGAGGNGIVYIEY